MTVTWTIFWMNGEITFVHVNKFTPKIRVRSIAIQNAAIHMNHAASNFFDAVEGDQTRSWIYNPFTGAWKKSAGYPKMNMPRI